jgi:AraC-like DNA-binding protein
LECRTVAHRRGRGEGIMTTSNATFRCEFAGRTNGPQYEMWREEFACKWFATDFKPIESDRIVCDIIGSTHSFLSICTARSTPVHLRRIASPPGPAQYLYIVVASDCRGEAFQRGQLHDLPLGHMALMSADESASGSQFTPGTRKSIRIPRKLLAETTLGLEDKIGKPVPAADALKQLLFHQVEIAQRVGAGLDAAANFALAQHIFDLASLCVGAHKDAAHLANRRGLAAARLDAVKADILKNLAGSHIRLPNIARRHGVSERYIQQLFESSGSSFTGFVLERRLNLAWRLLRDPTSRWRKISDIAASAGFSDISYFNRAFKARYGATPREIRGEA